MFDLIKKALTQFSTWQGVLKLVSATGLFVVTDDIANQLAQSIVELVTVILSLAGLIDIIRNEKKKKAASNISQSGALNLVPLIVVLCFGLGASGLVKQEGKGLKLDKQTLKVSKPVDYSKLND